MRAGAVRVIAAALAAAALAGCSPAPLMERLPESMGGLPADAPARPATPYRYPAVHDMPPPRAVKPLSDAQQTQIENELRTSRERLEREAGTAPKGAAAPARPGLRKKAAKSGAAEPAKAGAGSNP